MFRRLLRARDGNVAMMFGLILIPMLMAAGMGLDLQRTNTMRTRMQESADAGLLAAVRRKMMTPNLTIDDMEATARAFFDVNGGDKIKASLSPFVITYDSVSETYSLSFTGVIETMLLKAVGTKTMNADVLSQVKLGERPYLEIVMALDNTGSMNSDGKLADLKSAAKMLVSTLLTDPMAEVKIGLVPFAQYVSVGKAYKGSSWLSNGPAFMGCVGSRNYPDNVLDDNYAADPVPGLEGTPCPDALLPMTDNKSALDTAINAMDANGWTYIPAGLAWAWRVISPALPFDEGISYEELKSRKGFKAIILMTDGENTKSPSYPLHDGADVALTNQLTEELCDAVKAEDILIYTIAFQVTDTTIKSLLEECGTTKGHFYDANNAEELAFAFESIASSLRSISLSR